MRHERSERSQKPPPAAQPPKQGVRALGEQEIETVAEAAPSQTTTTSQLVMSTDDFESGGCPFIGLEDTDYLDF